MNIYIFVRLNSCFIILNIFNLFLLLFVSFVQIINKMNLSDQMDVLYFVSFDDVKISCL
jgi:hypothetical protein